MDNEAMNLFYTYGPLVFMVLVIYFLIIRPQRRQQKARQAMLDALKVGAKVVSIGGIYGTLTEVNEHTVKLKIADNVEIKMARGSINGEASAE